MQTQPDWDKRTTPVLRLSVPIGSHTELPTSVRVACGKIACSRWRFQSILTLCNFFVMKRFSDMADPVANPQQLASARRNAQYVVGSVLPFSRGDDAYREICKDYQPGFGTTCGCLVHWMLWMIGCSDTNLVNRSELGFQYRPGANISKLYSYTKYRDPIGPFSPEIGDILIIDDQNQIDKNRGSNRQYLHQHTFVILDVSSNASEITLTTGEAGNASPNAKSGAREASQGTRTITASGGGHSRLWISNSIGWKTFVLAWLPLSIAPFGPPPRAGLPY